VINDSADGKLSFKEFEAEGSTFEPVGKM